MSHSPEFDSSPGGISKRAAHRLIQRALVLANRDRNVRRHIRETHLTSVWAIEDWNLEWTVTFRRGELDFDRRVSRRADIRISWPTAEGFFAGAGGVPAADATEPEYDGPPAGRRTWEVVYRAFRAALHGLLQNPVDGDGRSLL